MGCYPTAAARAAPGVFDQTCHFSMENRSGDILHDKTHLLLVNRGEGSTTASSLGVSAPSPLPLGSSAAITRKVELRDNRGILNNFF